MTGSARVVASLALLAVAALAGNDQTVTRAPSNGDMMLAQYMRAVPAIACKRICVKSSGGTATHPPKCVAWKTVC